MPIDRAALVAGSIRLASGVSFLVGPLRAEVVVPVDPLHRDVLNGTQGAG